MVEHPMLKIPDLKPPPKKPMAGPRLTASSSKLTMSSSHGSSIHSLPTVPVQQPRSIDNLLNLTSLAIFFAGAVAGKLSFPSVALATVCLLTFVYMKQTGTKQITPQHQTKSHNHANTHKLSTSDDHPLNYPEKHTTNHVEHHRPLERERVFQKKRIEGSIDEQYAFRPYG